MPNIFEKEKIGTIAIIGLGYVGLPLAVEFGKLTKVIGFDISSKRVEELKAGYDSTLEVEAVDLDSARLLNFSSSKEDLKKINIYIVTVPTPIDSNNQPNLEPLTSASHLVGEVLSHGNYVIYESTVYPGATEEVCVPILENRSGLEYNKDFFVGYSPERINW